MWYRIFGFDSRSPPLVPHRSLMDPVRILPCHAALAQWQSACLVNRLQQSDSARRLSHGKGFAPAVRMDARRIGSLSRLRIPACSTALWVRLPPHPRHSAGSVDSMVHVGMICGVCINYMADSSNGQDGGFSDRRQGFDSPISYVRNRSPGPCHGEIPW